MERTFPKNSNQMKNLTKGFYSFHRCFRDYIHTISFITEIHPTKSCEKQVLDIRIHYVN